MTVAMIERKLFGGTCVNTGCIPTKTLVASAYAAHMARRGADYGVVHRRPGRRRHEEGQGAQGRGVGQFAPRRRNLARRHGALHGVPRPCALREPAHDERQRRDRSKPSASSSMSAAARSCPTCRASTRSTISPTRSILELDTLPRHLVDRRRQLYRARIRADVPPLRRRGDGDRARRAADPARGRGRLGRGEGDPRERRDHRPSRMPTASASRRTGDDIARCRPQRRRAARSSARICCWRSGGGRTPTISASTRPASRPTRRGYITVDDQLRTNVPGIWALGDCNGKGAFTHTSYNDFEIVAANLLDNDPRRVSDRIPTYALYIDPPLGRAGLTEAAVRKSGRQGAGRHAADDARRPRGREGRDAGLHEGGGRRRDARRSSARRSSASAATRRSTASST